MPSKIEWCEESWNPVIGCSKCSLGCTHCYAERMAHRLKGICVATATNPYCLLTGRNHQYLGKTDDNGNWTGNIQYCDWLLDIPLHWNKPRRIFVCSMSDLFHPKVPFEFILKMIGITIATPWHTYLILTKRPKRMYDFFACYPDGWFIREGMKHSTFSNEFFAIDSIKEILPDLSKANEYWKSNYDQSKRGKLDGPVPFPQPNVHLGVSISNQAEADEKIPILLQIPAAVRWLSIEPMLEGIDLTRIGGDKFGWGRIDILNGLRYMRANALEEGSEWETEPCEKINWVVVGGESGPGARPMHPDWARSIRDQCVAAGVPFYFKQWGEYLHESQGVNVDGPINAGGNSKKGYLWPDGTWSIRVGKKKAGCILDGKEWKQYPE